MVDFKKASEKAKLQQAEFLALLPLIAAYNALPAVVDDDYPMMRSRYETCLRDFLAACKANGRAT